MSAPDPVLVRVAEAAALGRQGRRGEAREVFAGIWADLCPDGDPLHRVAVAHAAADVQDDPQEELTDAVLLADHIGEVADSLIGHFVDRARRTGASWTEFGASTGVTKQAAQKRFVQRAAAESAAVDPSAGSSRFTPRARAVVVRAQEEARNRGNDRIAVGHRGWWWPRA